MLAGALLVGGLATSASAAEPRTKLVRCGTESCLRVSGHRESAMAIVLINGNVVQAEGGHRWEVDLPIDTVRDWSAPHARTIEVSLHDPESQRGISAEIDLPIGLLGGVTDLASLVVSVG